MVLALTNPDTWVALVTLTALEIILGIDNIVLISIVTGRLEPAKQPGARKLGLLAAVVSRLVLLGSIFWLTRLTAPLFTLLDRGVSLRDLVLIVGGIFLLAKSTLEIHHSLEGEEDETASNRSASSYAGVIGQILVLDMVFSLDSVITAVGMANLFWVMAAAMLVAVALMMLFVEAVSEFIHRHPTIKMLALSFLVLIGVALIGEGMSLHIPKGYIYFAMAFSVGVEMLNLRLRRQRDRGV